MPPSFKIHYSPSLYLYSISCSDCYLIDSYFNYMSKYPFSIMINPYSLRAMHKVL